MRCKIYAWAWSSKLKLSWSLVFWERKCFMELKLNEMQQQGLPVFTDIIRETDMAWDLTVFSAELFYKVEGKCLLAQAAEETLALQQRERWQQQSQDCPPTPPLEHGSVCPWHAAEQRWVGNQAPCLFRKILAEKRLNQNMLTVIIGYSSY